MKEIASPLPLVAILGPTASGKSALGVWLCERMGGEVVACDSTQLYRGFAIGTAKPTFIERRGVAHHLIDVLEPTEDASAGRYRELALDALKDLRTRRKLAVLTVGTGLYLRALLEGLAELPQRSEELRERLRMESRKHGPRHLHGVLRRLDAEAAKRIAAGDEQKLIRAIEVCLLTGKSLTEVHRAGRNPLEGWRVLKIGLRPEREALYRRIEMRTEKMLSEGWMDEVQELVGRGKPEEAKPFDFIGYRELCEVLEGCLAKGEARSAIQQATRNYAKRQLTWFRREPDVHWLEGFGDEEKIRNEALNWLRAQGLGMKPSSESAGV
jgi:tRNA dimethylallyltransferase